MRDTRSSKENKVYRLLNASTGAIVISRSVTVVGNAESVPVNPQSESTPCMIDVLGEGDDDEEIEDRSLTDMVNTHRSESQRSVLVGIEPTERPTGAIPTRQSRIPGRDGGKEAHVRPVRKKQAIRRYKTRLSKPASRPINLTDFEGDQNSMYGFSAKDDGESGLTYDQVLQIKLKENG